MMVHKLTDCVEMLYLPQSHQQKIALALFSSQTMLNLEMDSKFITTRVLGMEVD